MHFLWLAIEDEGWRALRRNGTEGRYCAALTLLANYTAGSFVAVADVHGGTLITEGQTGQPLLANPRA
jgi:hypothetical protein